MKLPKQSAGQSIAFSGRNVNRNLLAVQTAANGVQMEGFFSNLAHSVTGKLKSMGSCAIGCGPNAISCIHCGMDKDCWISCAGPAVGDCIISKCL
ncbi:MAG: hypothetical protein HQK84_07425 [Nitrospinae bacterium]|nr:hypothetical protein [Nitrospinota bacterium]